MHLGFVWVGPGFAPVMDYVLVSWMSGGIFHTRVASVLASGWARLVLDSLFLGGYLEVSSASRVRASRAALGRVRNCSKAHGSGRVGSRGFQIWWVGSDRVKDVSNLPGRVGSGQEVMKGSRVESDHDPRETGHSRVGSASPVSCFLLTRGSDPRVRLADPTLEPLPALLPK